MIQGVRISVAATATALSSAVNDKHGHSVVVQNPSGGATVYLGGSTVTSSVYGYALTAGTDITMDLEIGEALYGITASGTNTVNVLRTGRPTE